MTRLTPDGTPEREWQAWWVGQPPGAVPPLDLSELSGAARVVVLAAHPDDEMLAVGGLCRRLHDEGVPLTFVWASDGGASFDTVADVGDMADLPALRRREALGGLAALGVMPSQTHFLGLPDGRLTDHVDQLQRALDGLITVADVVLAPWSHDRHPDHEVCGRVALASRAAHVLQYPVWLWHWAVPDEPEVPWQRMRSVVLSPLHVMAKAAGVAEHDSQIVAPAAAPAVGAVLPPSVLEYFGRSVEVVIA